MPRSSLQHGSSPFLTWCRLLRLPNLFTVPGDPIAGYLLASGGVFGWEVLGAVAASMCLYCGGLLLNDYFDRDVDARERPERPIPSGDVEPGLVLGAGSALLALGVFLCCAYLGQRAGAVAGGLALLVYGYNAGLKRVRWVGPLAMGGCRAGSVLIGTVIASGPSVTPGVLAAGVTGLYTAAVTMVAADEVTAEPLGKVVYAPTASLVLGGGVMLFFFAPSWAVAPFLGLAVLALAGVHTARAATAVQRGQLQAPVFIGRLIRVMIPVQLAWSLWRFVPWMLPPWLQIVQALVLCGIFAALSVGAQFAARRFYGS